MTLVDTRAPASRQTLAAADSTGKPRLTLQPQRKKPGDGHERREDGRTDTCVWKEGGEARAYEAKGPEILMTRTSRLCSW